MECAGTAQNRIKTNKSASNTSTQSQERWDTQNISGMTRKTSSVMKEKRRRGKQRREEKKQKSFRNIEGTEMTMTTKMTGIKEEEAEESSGRKRTQQGEEKEEAAVPAGRREVTVEATVEDGDRERAF